MGTGRLRHRCGVVVGAAAYSARMPGFDSGCGHVLEVPAESTLRATSSSGYGVKENLLCSVRGCPYFTLFTSGHCPVITLTMLRDSSAYVSRFALYSDV